MQNQKLITATLKFLNIYAPYCTHALTLQTNISTYNVTKAKMQLLNEIAIRNTRYFVRRLATTAYGNGATRKTHTLHPLVISSIEGTLNNYDKNKTLHTHIALGNILTPQSHIKTEEQLIKTIKTNWLATEIGVADIVIKKINSNDWINYITKELYEGNVDCVDWTNTHIPYKALLN